MFDGINLPTTPRPPTKPTKVVRLEPEVYASLEKQFSKPVVTENTTAHQAGYQLGIHAVLAALRKGFVVDA